MHIVGSQDLEVNYQEQTLVDCGGIASYASLTRDLGLWPDLGVSPGGVELVGIASPNHGTDWTCIYIFEDQLKAMVELEWLLWRGRSTAMCCEIGRERLRMCSTEAIKLLDAVDHNNSFFNINSYTISSCPAHSSPSP